MTPLREVTGLGPSSAKKLADVGITSAEQLRDMGPVFAFVTVKRKHPDVTLNLLWAIAAGLQDRHWTALQESEKETLRQAVCDMGFDHFV